MTRLDLTIESDQPSISYFHIVVRMSTIYTHTYSGLEIHGRILGQVILVPPSSILHPPSAILLMADMEKPKCIKDPQSPTSNDDGHRRGSDDIYKTTAAAWPTKILRLSLVRVLLTRSVRHRGIVAPWNRGEISHFSRLRHTFSPLVFGVAVVAVDVVPDHTIFSSLSIAV